jgi:hypothetical protein
MIDQVNLRNQAVKGIALGNDRDLVLLKQV